MSVMGRTKFRSLRKKKRKFHGNQYTQASVVKELKERGTTESSTPLRPMPRPEVTSSKNSTPNTSTDEGSFISSSSFSKLQGNEIHADARDCKVTGNRIIDIESLCSVIALLGCPSCKETTLSLHEVEKQGSARKLKVACSCEWVHEFWSSEKISNGAFDINRRMVYGARACGLGYSGLERFHAMLNLPPTLTRNNYDIISKLVSVGVKKVAEETMSKAVEEIAEKGVKDDKGVVEVAVSGDGTWQRRGYSWLNGIFACMSIDSGKVLDIEPMSRYCKVCVVNKKIKESDPNKYEVVKAEHKCKANYHGSAPNMEAVGAKRIFERSVAKNNLRYVEFYGDGDSKSFSTIENVYPEKKVIKRECIGHVQKRVGTRLRKLKKNVKGLGGKGKLTDGMIDKLQNYYGIAIRSNPGDLEGMKKAIHASLFHVASSEKNSWHQHCPDGKDSWCTYKADIANGTNTYKPGKGLPLEVIKHVKPIFKDLSYNELLMKCLHGKTQNQNEAFNGMIWNRLPKATYVGFDQLKLGIYDAVATLNIGYKAVLKLYEALGMKPGKYTIIGCQKLNNDRLKNASKQNHPNTKTRHRILRGMRKSKEDKNKENEGKTYGPGSF